MKNTQTLRNLTNLGLLICGLTVLSGCASLLTSSEKPAAIYVLHPQGNGPVQTVPSQVIEVSMPGVPDGFDTDRIALYWDKGRRLDYYAAAHWPAPLDRMLQGFTIQTIHSALSGAVVVTPDIGLTAAHGLLIKVAEFQPVYANGPGGVPDLSVSMKFTLVSIADAKVEDDFTFAAHRMAASNDLTAITSGLEALTQSVLAQAVARIGADLQPAPIPSKTSVHQSRTSHKS